MTSQPKKYYLSQNDKQIAGVCGGFAEYFNVDSTIVRLVVVLLTVITGFLPFLIAYVALAAIAPKAPGSNIDKK